MDLQTEVVLTAIKLSADSKSISIPVKHYVEIEGERLYKNAGKPKRRVFFAEIKEYDEDANVIGAKENKNFRAEVDEWTGQKDFIKNTFNF